MLRGGAAIVALGLMAFPMRAALSAGSISVPNNTTSRIVAVKVTPPGTNIHWVRFSEDPDLNRSNGIRIAITHLHTNLDYADLNITFPNGVPGGRAWRGSLPNWTNHLRILVVPVRLADGVELPSFGTNGWFQRLVFGETNGPDMRNVPNSLRRYFEQNSYGRFQVSGDVYPHWVTVGEARRYSAIWPTGSLPEQYVEDAITSIQAETPTFFVSNRYDMVVTLHPGEFYATGTSFYDQTTGFSGISSNYFRTGVHVDLPIEPNSALLQPITNEINTVSNSIYVRPKFRPEATTGVIGVWLASDMNRTGPNYFLGGSFDKERNVVTLGLPVPAGNDVRVDYRLPNGYTTVPGTPFFSDAHVSVWYGMFLHEFTHALGPHITFTGTDEIGDFSDADLVENYSLMGGGNHNRITDGNTQWNEPACFDAAMRYTLGLVNPFEPRYGENETNVRLYAAEEFPYTERVKLIKVPLHREGTLARRRLHTMDRWGDEYLLVELRKKGPVPGLHNFDRALPHEGVLIYHVLEQTQKRIGAQFQNFVRIMDATPEPHPGAPKPILIASPYYAEVQSIIRTPAPFGFDSGKFEYVHAAPWQNIVDSNLYVRLEGRGAITLYAQFRDYTYTNESELCSATVNYVPWPDVNTNSLSDTWEVKYFGSTSNTNGAPGADPDGDGLPNLGEFLAGTNPTNAESTVRIRINGTNGVVIDSGAFGYVEHTHDLSSRRWMREPSGGPAWLNWRQAPGRQRYFRIRTGADE